MHRLSVLAVFLAVLGLAGCSLVSPAEPSNPDIHVSSNSDDPRTFTISVANASTSEVVFSNTTTLDPNGEVVYEDILEVGTYEVTITLDTGEHESYRWRKVSPGNVLHVDLRGIRIAFNGEGVY